MTAVFDDGAVVLHHGDARRVPIDDGTAACAVWSPPYNVGLAYDVADDVLPWPEYEELAAATAVETARVLCEGGRAWVNVTPVVPVVPPGHDDDSGERVSLLHVWDRALLAAGLTIRDYVVWYTPGRGGGCAWGSWASPSGPNLRGEWETVIVAHKGPWQRETPAEFKGWKDTIDDWTSLVSNVWRVQPEQARDDHPAPFPVELAARAIRLSSWPGELVVDQFAGTGTTLKAARDLSRRAVGVELSEAYCRAASERLGHQTFDFGGSA